MTDLVLSIDQPWASLIMAGVKRFETRPAPPNGDMRPDGVRGLSGARVNRGDRLLIASTLRYSRDTRVGPWALYGGGVRSPLRALDIPSGAWIDLPLGRILGSVTVTDAYPIVDKPDADSDTYVGVRIMRRHYDGEVHLHHHRRWLGGSSESHRMDDQRPLGDWTPGRWAWALADPVPTTERCPWCEGEGTVPSAKGWPRDACPLCRYDGKCEPVPVVGKQGVWRWDGTVRP